MARPLRITFPGAFYHITSRGNERKHVFKSKRDREKFLEYLESATQRYAAVIHVYCLLDNHRVGGQTLTINRWNDPICPSVPPSVPLSGLKTMVLKNPASALRTRGVISPES